MGAGHAVGVARVVLLVVLLLTACSAAEPTPVRTEGAGHVGADVDTAADRTCVAVGEARDLPPAFFTGSSSITLAEVRAVAGAADVLASGPYARLPGTHPVDACFYDDGRTVTSLLVDAEGRVAVNPAVPKAQG